MIENKDISLHVLYSDMPSIGNYMESIIQEAAEASMASAWLREKNLVQTGFTGYGDWTASQKSELIAMRPGNLASSSSSSQKSSSASTLSGVRGYEAVEIQPRIKFPHLIRDQSNYGFVSETLQQRRRKNRHGKSRKYA